ITSEVDETGRPKKPGVINGGFFQKTNDRPDQYPSVVIGVDDIRVHMKKVRQAGEEPLGEPMEIPGVGLYLSFRDTEGNRVAMLQPNMPAPRQMGNHRGRSKALLKEAAVDASHSRIPSQNSPAMAKIPIGAWNSGYGTTETTRRAAGNSASRA